MSGDSGRSEDAIGLGPLAMAVWTGVALPYKVALISLPLGGGLGLGYWWASDTSWGVRYGYAAATLIVGTALWIVWEWLPTSRKTLDEDRSTRFVSHIHLALAALGTVLAASLAALIWGPWLRHSEFWFAIGAMSTTATCSVVLIAWSRHGGQRKSPGMLHVALLVLAAWLVGTLCLVVAFGWGGLAWERLAVAAFAELSVVAMVMLSVPSNVLRKVWERRWTAQVIDALGPLPEDHGKVDAESLEGAVTECLWGLSLWADVLKVTALITLITFAENGGAMRFGLWPAAALIVLSWAYLNYFMAAVSRIVRAGRDDQGIGESPVDWAKHRVDNALHRLEPTALLLDVLIWTFLIWFAFPFGLRFLPLFLFSALPTFQQIIQDSRRSMAEKVVAVLSLRTRNEAPLARWQRNVRLVLGCAILAGVGHALLRNWQHLQLPVFLPMMTTAPAIWAHLRMPDGSIAQGLVSYVGLFAVMLWRMMHRYQEQAVLLARQVNEARRLAGEFRKLFGDLEKAYEERNKANDELLEAYAKQNELVVEINGKMEELAEAALSQDELNRAVATALHNLKNDAWLLAEPLERGLHMSPLDPPRWLDLSRALLMTWLVAENHEVPVSFSRVCRSTDVQVPPPDAALVLAYHDVMSDIVEIMLKGYTVGEGSPWYTELWEAKCSSLGQHLADADLPSQTHCPLVAALKQAREDPRCPLADPTQLSAVRTALGEYVGKHVLSWGQGVEAAYQVNFEGVEEEVRERVRYGVVSCLRSALRELTRNAFAAAVAAPEFALQFVVRESEGQVHFRVANAGELGETGKLASGRDAVERFSKLTRASLFIPPTQISSEAAGATDATLAICRSPGCQGPDAWVVSGLSYRLEQNNVH